MTRCRAGAAADGGGAKGTTTLVTCSSKAAANGCMGETGGIWAMAECVVRPDGATTTSTVAMTLPSARSTPLETAPESTTIFA